MSDSPGRLRDVVRDSADVTEWFAPVFREHTDTPDDCFFGVWHGNAFGYELVRDFRIARDSVLSLPGREYVVLRGPIDAAKQSPCAAEGGEVEGELEAVNLWWPADRRWLVATDIEDTSTYIGIDARGAQALAAHESWETFPVQPQDCLMDTINPEPERPAREPVPDSMATRVFKRLFRRHPRS